MKGSLLVHTEIVLTGSDQSAPVATFHFGAAIRLLCATLQTVMAVHDAMAAWIVEDCSIAGCLDGVLAGTKCIQEESHKYGLELKGSPIAAKSKLKLWTPCMPAGDDKQLGVSPCPLGARRNVKKTHEIFS